MLVLYVDVIMLAENNKGMLHDVKQYLSKTFEMKDMGETSYVIGIEILLRQITRIVEFVSERTYQ